MREKREGDRGERELLTLVFINKLTLDNCNSTNRAQRLREIPLYLTVSHFRVKEQGAAHRVQGPKTVAQDL